MQLLKEYKYLENEAKNNTKISKIENIIVILFMIMIALTCYFAYKFYVLGIVEDTVIFPLAYLFILSVALFELFRTASQKEKFLKWDLYIKTDDGYFIVETAKYLRKIFPHSTATKTYETRVKNELANSSAGFIIRALKPGCDVKYLYKYGTFYQITKVCDIVEKDDSYLLKLDCIKNGKRKFKNKKFEIYKVYEEIEEFISQIREL